MDHSTGPRRRAPETREAALARAANDYICPTGSRRPLVAFGAPVTSTEIVYYERATEILCKSRPPGQWFAFKNKPWPLGQWFGFENDVDAARQLGKVARGMRPASSLPTQTSDAFTQLERQARRAIPRRRPREQDVATQTRGRAARASHRERLAAAPRLLSMAGDLNCSWEASGV